MTWHNAVYGSRNGSDALGRPFDDGPVYGRVPDELIPEERLRRLGGKSFYRAHEVIDSARIHDFGYAYTDDGITLTALRPDRIALHLPRLRPVRRHLQACHRADHGV